MGAKTRGLDPTAPVTWSRGRAPSPTWLKKKTDEKMMAMRFTTLHTPWDTGLTRCSVLNANCGAGGDAEDEGAGNAMVGSGRCRCSHAVPYPQVLSSPSQQVHVCWLQLNPAFRWPHPLFPLSNPQQPLLPNLTSCSSHAAASVPATALVHAISQEGHAAISHLPSNVSSPTLTPGCRGGTGGRPGTGPCRSGAHRPWRWQPVGEE